MHSYSHAGSNLDYKHIKAVTEQQKVSDTKSAAKKNFLPRMKGIKCTVLLDRSKSENCILCTVLYSNKKNCHSSLNNWIWSVVVILSF